jgi:hypothetical protein
MKRLECLKILKSMCKIETLSHFQVYKGMCDDSVIFASCLADYSVSIYVAYDTIKKTYRLSVNYNSVIINSFINIFTDEFSQKVFEAIQLIFLEKECKKHDK